MRLFSVGCIFLLSLCLKAAANEGVAVDCSHVKIEEFALQYCRAMGGCLSAKGVNATVKAETKMGSIGGSSFPWERKEQTVRPLTGDEAKLTLGKGFASVDLASRTGSITLQ